MTEDTTTETRTYHRNIVDGDNDPEVALVHELAEIKGVDEAQLTQLYTSIAGMVEELFYSPPPADTLAELTFSYENYRITLYQDGQAVFRQIKE